MDRAPVGNQRVLAGNSGRGDFLYTSGQGPLDPQTLHVVGSTVEVETK